MHSRVINGFRKTDHCLLRQKERDIPDSLLSLIFSSVSIKAQKRLYLIVKNSSLKSLNYEGHIPFSQNNNAGLVIRMSKKCITTCYFCEDPDYLYQAHPEFDFFHL
jgi:hypothetical protein